MIFFISFGIGQTPRILYSPEQILYFTSFENNYSFLRIDSTQSSNIWQVGKPRKLIFDSAYTQPFALVTDTVNPYPVNNRSSFEIKLKRPDTAFCWSTMTLSFLHKYETDSLYDGGYIEISYDGGINWINVIEDTTLILKNLYFYKKSDTINGGCAAFSGNSKKWNPISIIWERGSGIAQYTIDFVIIRFSFVSDSIDSGKSGWLIDELLLLVSNGCTGSINELSSKKTSKVYPNPVINNFVIEFENSKSQNCQLQIFNLLGEKCFEKNHITENKILLGKNIFKFQGIYFYRIIFPNNITIHGKFFIY